MNDREELDNDDDLDHNTTHQLATLSPSKANPPELIPSGERILSTSSLPVFNPILLPPDSFTVELVLDTREVQAKTNRTYIEKELTKKGVQPIVRALAIGDFFWVAKMREKNSLARYGVEGDEVTLDYIVERKRLDDLIGSIKDGRFHEQKFRLKRSGIKNVILHHRRILTRCQPLRKVRGGGSICHCQYAGRQWLLREEDPENGRYHSLSNTLHQDAKRKIRKTAPLINSYQNSNCPKLPPSPQTFKRQATSGRFPYHIRSPSSALIQKRRRHSTCCISQNANVHTWDNRREGSRDSKEVENAESVCSCVW